VRFTSSLGWKKICGVPRRVCGFTIAELRPGCRSERRRAGGPFRAHGRAARPADPWPRPRDCEMNASACGLRSTSVALFCLSARFTHSSAGRHGPAMGNRDSRRIQAPAGPLAAFGWLSFIMPPNPESWRAFLRLQRFRRRCVAIAVNAARYARSFW